MDEWFGGWMYGWMFLDDKIGGCVSEWVAGWRIHGRLDEWTDE